ncbi:MAG TPA: ATP-dependent RNA helicase HrpA, partial [Beutenbergiaceae bacterium]|nr:ATP-dependent RNA helicase HrpA [Beutenbergiaceae bacterium]
ANKQGADGDDKGRSTSGRRRSAAGAGREEPLDQTTAICLAADELMAEGPGDILVFCSGEREIRDASEALTKHLEHRPGPPVEILQLYARLSAAEQHRVFAPHSGRRIVLATNIAETSLTVPGIRYVIDTGTARISRYSARTKVQRLPIEPVSRASADQRAGRSGRVADGICIRLYSRADYESRPEFTEPEILRTSLASVILQMTALGLGEVADFGFVDPPDTRAVRDGVALLTELGAITDDDARRGHDGDAPREDRRPSGRSAPGRTTPSSGQYRLTKVGRALARLPIDPRLGRMIIEADRLGCAAEVLIIVAALSIQDVRERPADATQQADEKHRRFADPHSDFMAILNLWDYLRRQRKELSSSAFRRMCRAEFLHFLRIREWQDIHGQLRQMIKPLGIHLQAAKPPEKVDADALHQAILSGLLTHIGAWDERRREYTGARGARFVIFPGSHLAKKNPEWGMAAELVETARLFARTAARIRPEWVEPLAGHLIKRTYSDPYWSTKQGAGMVKEKVLLLGLTLAADRPVPYARVDPEAAREMFIREALVGGQWQTHHRFATHNAEVLTEAEEIQARERRRDLVLDEEGLFDFYDARVPEHVVTATYFDTWWKKARQKQPDLLNLTLADVLPPDHELDEASFPSTWMQGDLTLPLTYQFEPGTEADGVTVHIPIEVLPRVRPEGFDWLVPGLLEELTVAAIRALPKPVRRHLVPAPDVAAQIRTHLPPWEEVAPAPPGAPSFREAFTAAAQRLREVTITAEDWDPERLPAHLRMTFQVHDASGAVLGTGQNLVALQQQLAAQSAGAVRTAVGAALDEARRRTQGRPGPPKRSGGDEGGRRSGSGAAARSDHDGAGAGAGAGRATVTPGLAEEENLTDWPGIEEIPELVTATGAGGLQVRGYPALVADGKDVHLRVLSDAAARDGAHPDGVAALLARTSPLPAGRITSRWTGQMALTLATSPYRNTDALAVDLARAAVGTLTTPEELRPVRSRSQFRQVSDRVHARLEDEVYRLAQVTAEIFAESRDLERTISGTTSLTLLDVLTDVREQHANLIFDGFLTATPPDRL